MVHYPATIAFGFYPKAISVFSLPKQTKVQFLHPPKLFLPFFSLFLVNWFFNRYFIYRFFSYLSFSGRLNYPFVLDHYIIDLFYFLAILVLIVLSVPWLVVCFLRNQPHLIFLFFNMLLYVLMSGCDWKWWLRTGTILKLSIWSLCGLWNLIIKILLFSHFH